MNRTELNEIESFIASIPLTGTATLLESRDIIIRLLAEVECLEEELKSDRQRNFN